MLQALADLIDRDRPEDTSSVETLRALLDEAEQIAVTVSHELPRTEHEYLCELIGRARQVLSDQPLDNQATQGILNEFGGAMVVVSTHASEGRVKDRCLRIAKTLLFRSGSAVGHAVLSGGVGVMMQQAIGG